MALKVDILGMVWRYPDTFVVGREQVRQYAQSVKANDPGSLDEAAAAELGHSAIIAPPTFMSIFAVMIQRHFFQHVDVGMVSSHHVVGGLSPQPGCGLLLCDRYPMPRRTWLNLRLLVLCWSLQRSLP